MKLKKIHLNEAKLNRFHAILEDIFRGSEIDPIAQDSMEEVRNVLETVANSPDEATDEEIVAAIKYYAALRRWLDQLGPKLAEAKKVLDIATAYRSDNPEKLHKAIKQ